MFLSLFADLNLVVWYGIVIRTCMRGKKLAYFNLAAERQTPKFNSLQDFSAIRYDIFYGNAQVVLKRLQTEKLPWAI